MSVRTNSGADLNSEIYQDWILLNFTSAESIKCNSIICKDWYLPVA
jgi:hypothetical protein